MKILVLSCNTRSIVRFRADMIRDFTERGHTVTAVGDEPEAEWKDIFARDGIDYRSIPVSRTGTNPFADIAALRAIKKLLKELNPDKIFAYQAKTVIYGGMAAEKQGIDFYPLIAGVGSVYLDGGLKNRLLRGLVTAQYKKGIKKAKCVFFHNGYDLEYFKKLGIVKGDNLVVLNGSGVDVDHFSPAPMPPKPAFICISRLIRDKGVDNYLQACRIFRQKMPDVKCMLVGPFDSNPSSLTQKELQSYIDDGSVEYYGEQDDVRPYLAQCMVFVLPSFHEGRPKTILEAMAMGRAILTTDVPGCRDTVDSGKNGLLVPAGDPQALAQAMEHMAKNTRLVAEMASEGRRIAETRYDVRMVNAIIMDKMGL